MSTVLVILPILRDHYQVYHSNAQLREAVDLAGGIKSLAEWCLFCYMKHAPQPYDCEVYIYGISEEIFAKLDVPEDDLKDIDPRLQLWNERKLERHQRTMTDYLLSDAFLVFLHDFYDQHSSEYAKIIGTSRTFTIDNDYYHCRRPDAIAVRLAT